jgi:hypothetical protein
MSDRVKPGEPDEVPAADEAPPPAPPPRDIKRGPGAVVLTGCLIVWGVLLALLVGATFSEAGTPADKALLVLAGAAVLALPLLPVGLVTYLLLRFVPVALDARAERMKAAFGSPGAGPTEPRPAPAAAERIASAERQRQLRPEKG